MAQIRNLQYDIDIYIKGPITVRVQEPGGTFDTEVRLEEFQKKYEIIYHTKYKRIRRGASKKGGKKGEDDGDEEDLEEEKEEGNVILGAEDDNAALLDEPDR